MREVAESFPEVLARGGRALPRLMLKREGWWALDWGARPEAEEMLSRRELVEDLYGASIW
jgi:hypothetical protein